MVGLVAELDPAGLIGRGLYVAGFRCLFLPRLLLFA